MRITFDKEVNAAYIYLSDSGIPAGAAVKQVAVNEPLPGRIVLDFDNEDRLLGIEVLDALQTLPAEALDSA